MFKRILTLALAVSFVAPVAAEKSGKSADQSTRSGAVVPLGVAAIVASLIFADKRFNEGRSTDQAVKLSANMLKQLQESGAYEAATQKAASLMSYLASTRGVTAARDAGMAVYNRAPAMPRTITIWQK